MIDDTKARILRALVLDLLADDLNAILLSFLTRGKVMAISAQATGDHRQGETRQGQHEDDGQADADAVAAAAQEERRPARCLLRFVSRRVLEEEHT